MRAAKSIIYLLNDDPLGGERRKTLEHRGTIGVSDGLRRDFPRWSSSLGKWRDTFPPLCAAGGSGLSDREFQRLGPDSFSALQDRLGRSLGGRRLPASRTPRP